MNDALTDPELSEARRRIPLWKDEWLENLRRLRFHPCAPEWNTECGDRQGPDEARFVRGFEQSLYTERVPFGLMPPPPVLRWLAEKERRSLFLQKQLHRLDPIRHAERDWRRIPTMRRQDLQNSLHLIVPQDLDFDGLIVNPTSGTTGHPIPCPSHVRAAGCYEPLVLFALRAHGLRSGFGPKSMAAIQVCHQQSTIVYGTVHSYLDGAGFAKVNLHPGSWEAQKAQAYITAMAPVFLSGDPYAFYRMMEMGLHARPEVLLSTALQLDPERRSALESWFQAPVCDVYSSNETGPMAFSDPGDPSSYLVLPPDIFLEIVDTEGNPVPPGEVGEIVFTGGRNPFLPLLRYRTGDFGALDFSTPAGRDPMPRLKKLSGRTPVIFTAATGAPVNPIDIGRIIRGYPVAVFQFVQDRSGDCELRLEAPALPDFQQKELQAALEELLEGRTVRLSRALEHKGGKILPFIVDNH